MNEHQRFIDKFRIKPGKEYLRRDDFEYWPVWSEHYDYEEIEDIERWGVDREWVLQKFREYDTGGPHPHYTVLDLENLPFHNMRIFIKARFVTPCRQELTGYIMNHGELGIAIFGRNEDYLFSNHPSLSNEMKKRHKEAVEEFNVTSLFPLKFETEFNGASGQRIAGAYELGG